MVEKLKPGIVPDALHVNVSEAFVSAPVKSWVYEAPMYAAPVLVGVIVTVGTVEVEKYAAIILWTVSIFTCPAPAPCLVAR